MKRNVMFKQMYNLIQLKVTSLYSQRFGMYFPFRKSDVTFEVDVIAVSLQMARNKITSLKIRITKRNRNKDV